MNNCECIYGAILSFFRQCQPCLSAFKFIKNRISPFPSVQYFSANKPFCLNSFLTVICGNPRISAVHNQSPAQPAFAKHHASQPSCSLVPFCGNQKPSAPFGVFSPIAPFGSQWCGPNPLSKSSAVIRVHLRFITSPHRFRVLRVFRGSALCSMLSASQLPPGLNGVVQNPARTACAGLQFLTPGGKP